MGAKGRKPAQISGFKCHVKNCQKWTCIGCHQRPTLGSKTIPTSVAHVNHCCDKGRLFGIYILLSRFDEVELQLHQDTAKKEMKRWSTISRAGTGTGYASEDGFYSRMFAGSRGYDLNWQDAAAKSRKEDVRTEGMVKDLMILLTAFLPNPRYESKFDKSPPPELYALLRMSLLMDRVSTLVRNDSVTDLGKRASLYNALLDFIIAIGKHPLLVKILVEERVDKKKSPGVQFLGDMSKRSSCIFDNSPDRMRASVIATGLPTLKHTGAFLGLFRNTVLAGGFRTINNQDSAITICRKFRDLYKVIDQTAPTESNKITFRPKDPWMEFNEKNRVDFTESVLERHCFYTQFCHSQTSTRGRMAALMKEIASLSTSLPPGIFLKISESRPDVMKVLIAGVDGSTYEGGLFA
jgi:hypothetical protein